MRPILILMALALLATPVIARNLDDHRIDSKPAQAPGQNPGTPDGREGGETIETAIPIPGLPFSDTGNTSDNVHDYDEVCPYSGSTSPDVVYSWSSPYSTAMDIDLCGSGYDTKVYVYDQDLNVVACNDDYYFDDSCGLYVSYIPFLVVEGGNTYYIVIDGYGGDHGDYILEMNEYSIQPPCELECLPGGVPEGEPPLVDGYVDEFNAGCGQHSGGNAWTALVGDENGDLLFCGHGGWYLFEDSYFRDTDWFTAVIGPTGAITWHLIAELDTYGFYLGPNDCADVAVLMSMEVGPCEQATMTVTGEPGDVVWLWTGAATFEPPGYAFWNEYLYLSTFQGLASGPVSTSSMSFDRVKSLYR